MTPRTVHFEKWEGLGNDFLVVEGPPTWSDAEVRAACDRRRGVGGDGVLFVERGPSPRMVVRNADGSRPEMCGNGLRCVAAFLVGEVGPSSHGLTVATDAGPRPCRVAITGPGLAEVTIAMGPARSVGRLAVDFEGRQIPFAQVDVGNPHAISFAAWDEPLVDRLGPFVERLPAAGTNVELCRHEAGARRIDVVVWERGVGRTLACGTGACAVAAAAAAEGRVPYDVEVEVALPGGSLWIQVSGESHETQLRGPARRVFSGELTLP
jgi:diaminopimelate epimerase